MTDPQKRTIAVIGGGPAGLMAAEVLSRRAANEVTVYDAMPSLGRKFLMAGRGGLNLTHSEAFDAFIERYGARADRLRGVISAWSPQDVRVWCEALGQETFVGSSGRVFPKIMKASGLLRAWLRRLADQGVDVQTRHRWIGWDEQGQLRFETPNAQLAIPADATVLALGGGSWRRLGSDGGWVELLRNVGIDVQPLQPANAGFEVDWSDVFRTRFEGQPLKSIAIEHGGHSVRGEAIMTARGIEGGAVYALSGSLREQVTTDGQATLAIDLKPDVGFEALTRQLARPRGKQSMATYLRKNARLSPVAIGVLQEIAAINARPLGDMEPVDLAALVKRVPLTVSGIASIDKAISTAGGVEFSEINNDYMLVKRPGVFIAGEMLDWEAPTGGYLLQACFATGVAAGEGVDRWLQASGEE